MKKGHRLAGALCANALIVILEGISLVLSIVGQGLESFLFYTQDSNYLTMAISLLFCVYAAKELRGKGRLPRWLHTMRYISVSCLMLTFFVVIFVLMPAMGENALSMLLEGSMLYQHTLCPVLSLLSFLAFEIEDKLPKADMLKALVPTLVYALIAITLNIGRVIVGPYPFLMVYAQPWYASVLWCIILPGIAGLLAFIVWKAHNIIWKRSSKIRNP